MEGQPDCHMPAILSGDTAHMKLLILAAVLMTCAAPQAAGFSQADIRACNGMAKSAKNQKAEVEQLKTARDALAQAAEEAGARWEDAEIHRNASARHAAAADAAKAEWDAAREAVRTSEAELQARVSELNATAAQYNARCAAE